MKEYIGSKVAKVFPGYGDKPFHGKVKDVVDVKGHFYYRIKYTDGDEEDITETELLKILVQDKKALEKKVIEKKRKGPGPSAKSANKKPFTTTAAAAAVAKKPAAAPGKKSKQRKLSQARGARAVPAEVQEEDASHHASDEEEEPEKLENFSEEQEEKEKSPSPAAVASAHARVSSLEKKLTGEISCMEQEQQEEEEEKKAEIAALSEPEEMEEEISTQEEAQEEEEEQEQEQVVREEQQQGEGNVNAVATNGIAPHEYLHPPEPDTAPPAPTTTTTTTTKGPSEQEIQRFEFSGPLPVQGISASAAVAANGFLFIGDITRPGNIPAAKQTNTPSQYYSVQVAEILKDLDNILKKARIGWKDLVTVDVQFKDSAVGYKPFCQEWNKWLGDTPAPALKMGESFMGEDCTLVSLSAVAKLPTGQ